MTGHPEFAMHLFSVPQDLPLAAPPEVNAHSLGSGTRFLTLAPGEAPSVRFGG